MKLILVFGAIIIGIIILSTFINYFFHSKKRQTLYANELIPPVWASHQTHQLFEQFNRAWSKEIEMAVNERIQKSNRKLKQSELLESWYELKKYLLLASLSKGLPMFSQKVDTMWHFFLEEDALYKDFCSRFIGESIEHHPHESPKYLPRERAWFDILYLSFFSITPHAHLWGKFLQEKDAYEYWIEQIHINPVGIKELHKIQRSDAPTVDTLDDFLNFAKEQLQQTDHFVQKRIQQADGYWYGPAIFGFAAYETIGIHEEQKKNNNTYGGDGGSSGYVVSDDQDNDWDKLTSDVNSIEVSSDSGPSSSDSGSSCSSCSGCSS